MDKSQKSFRIKDMIQVKLFQMIPMLVNSCKRKEDTGTHGQKKIDYNATIDSPKVKFALKFFL